MIERREGHPISHIARFSDVPFENHCIVIADEELPQSLLSSLPSPILVRSGEHLKTLASIEVLAERVLDRRATKPLTLVAVGGGSIGDAVGFLASVLWRGVTLWHIPTTLLAMIDSAHGGKTAVNLGAAKNQLGTFHTAERIFLVEECLASLPRQVRREGLAELLKALWLGDPGATDQLSHNTVERLATAPFETIRATLVDLIDRAIEVKMDIVAEDPRETRGIRTVLNLGHTIGHALELTARISHGEAVAWGLASALGISRNFGLSAEQYTKLLLHLHPLLRHIPDGPSREALLAAMQHDKKHHAGTLRSVVLQDVGRPMVTESVSHNEWLDAFESAYTWHRTTPVTASLVNARPVTVRVQPGKSELNRALVIAALRPGRTDIHGRSSSDDVRHMVRALQALGIPLEETQDGYRVDHSLLDSIESIDERAVYCGEGGTTFRFLLALCSMNRNVTKLYLAPSLAQRPHEALIRSLRSGGATIEPITDRNGQGYRVRGWDTMPGTLSVECTNSSQYASAIALLAAGTDVPFNLRLLGSAVSEPYFGMTELMLEQAGVEMIRGKDVVAFNQTSRLNEPFAFDIPPDASAEAVWKVAQFFEHPLKLPSRTDTMHPDTAIDTMLDTITSGQSQDEIVLDCSGCPDLVPLLAIAALRSSKPVRIAGAAHLRHKESNRIDELVASLNAIGITAAAKPDGIRIPARASAGLSAGVFETHGDHRLVMAGLMLSMITGSVTLSHPWAISKSYPGFWDDARLAGWVIAPSSLS